MGVNLRELISGKEVDLSFLKGKIIAIDAFNALYQFLSIIRDKQTGEPLKDSKGRITSHISGLFYRTSSLLENGIKPIFVFDGEAPLFKKRAIEKREEAKKVAERKWLEALEKGEEAITYAQAASKLSDQMVEESKQLLSYMGIPSIQAPSEGEAECAYLCKIGKADYSASQDYDSLLFGSPNLVRNISITGKRKLPRKEIYIEIKPEIINLNQVLESLKIDRERLIAIALLIGTDYNPEGIKGIGPKKALQIVKEEKDIDLIFKKVGWSFEYDYKDIFEFFKNPPCSDFEIKFEDPKEEKILKFMVDEREFSEERVRKALEKIKKAREEAKQKGLEAWLKK